MSFTPDNLLKSLDSPELVHWVPEMKNGPDAYAYLKDALQRRALTTNQMKNSIHAIFRLRAHGSSFDVLNVLVGLTRDPELVVRSEAVQVAIGLVRFSAAMEKIPVLFSDQQIASIRSAVQAGVTPEVKKQVEEYLEG